MPKKLPSSAASCFAILTFVITFAIIGCTKNGGSSGDSSTANGENPINREPRAQDVWNLKKIGYALHSHHDHTGYLPAAIFDKDGRPLLSWRVAILPHIDRKDLYEQFRLNEPWDSEHNKQLISKMPRVFSVPGFGRVEDGVSHYRIFASTPEVGDTETALFRWPDITQKKPPDDVYFSKITDGTSNTIMVAEADEAVIWTKPDALIYHPNQPVSKLGYFWNGKTHLLMADGSVKSIPSAVNDETIREAITRSGRFQFGADWQYFDTANEPPQDFRDIDK